MADRIASDFSRAQLNSYSLYELAKRKSWNPSTDLEWPARKSHFVFPTKEKANPLAGFAEYEALTQAQKLEAAWTLHGIELSEILFGEQAALMLAAQLVENAPTTDAKLFLSSQIFDEARHVEFFMRYISESVGHIHPPSSALKEIVDNALASQCWIHKLLSCHGLIESLAMARFQELRRLTNCQLLANAMDLILKDEARHVAFGIESLKSALKNKSTQERLSSGHKLIEQALALGQSIDSAHTLSNSFDWDESALRYHLRVYRIEHPELGKQCFRYLSLTLRKIGLWHDEFQCSLEKRGLLEDGQ